jgi:predicted ATPase/DNA-binding CsgD family transcriptional regulator
MARPTIADASMGYFAVSRALERSSSRDLPYEINRFIGRERELAELEALRAHARLLTLTGPGGVGKTRLAIRLAAQAQTHYLDGVVYLDAATVESADGLPAALATSAGVRRASEFEDIATALDDRHLLLVLDNCSQHVATCAELAMTLLSLCPRVQIIATSRERLSVSGEILWQVPPLATPEPGVALEDIASSPAVQLLVERMVEVNPHFVLDESTATDVAEICRRVDGMPLSLELVAGWINALSLGEIAERLDDPLRLLTRGARGAPTRHQTLRATLDWSTAQLSERERRLFERLSVFAGSWDLDAARGVCADDDLSVAQVLPVLADLVGKSLVQVVSRDNGAAARFRLLDAVRQYAFEKLESAGHARDFQQRHAAWYRTLVDSVPIGDGSPDQLELLLREQGNLRAAMDWGIAEGDASLAFGLGVRMHGVWYIQGQFVESDAWFKRLLALPGGSDLDRTLITTWAGMHALSQGDFAAARSLCEQAHQLAALAADPVLDVFSLDGQGSILLDQGKLHEAAAVFTREQQLLSDANQDWLLACAQYRLGTISLEFGDDLDAQRLCEEALTLLGPQGNLWIRLRIERVLGRIALQRGDVEIAEARFESMLRGARQLGDLQGLVYALTELSQVAHVQRHLIAARSLLREALEVAQRDGEPLVLARALESAAAVLASARPEGCLQIVASAQRLRGRLGATAWPLERARLDRTLEVAHGRLSATAVAVATASGEVIGVERAVRLARELLDSLDPSASAGGLPPHDILTPRELGVAELVAKGLTNRAIAKTLVISEGTVRAHVEHILSKLGLRSRTEIGMRLERSNQPRATPE